MLPEPQVFSGLNILITKNFPLKQQTINFFSDPETFHVFIAETVNGHVIYYKQKQKLNELFGFCTTLLTTDKICFLFNIHGQFATYF